MFPDLTKFAALAENGLTEVKNILCHIWNENKATREAAQMQARSMAFEFGVVDGADTPQIAPRRLSSLPVIVEATTTKRDTVDVQAINQGRAVSRGFYANLGDTPLMVTLIGVGGQSTIPHTVPPATTISLTCLVSQVIIDPVDGGAANYQLYMQ